MVCKVADFGLSRRVQTEDNTGDYYRRYGAQCAVSVLISLFLAGKAVWQRTAGIDWATRVHVYTHMYIPSRGVLNY